MQVLRFSVCIVLLNWIMAITMTAAEPWTVTLENTDHVVRQGVLWRTTITGQVPTSRFNDGPYLLQISLTQAGTIIAAQDIPLQKLGQLVPGVRLAIPVTEFPAAQENITVLVTVSNNDRRDVQSTKQTLVTPLGIQRSLEQQYKTLVNPDADVDPMLALWFEQAGELMLGQANLHTCENLLAIEQQIHKWQVSKDVSGTLRAFRDRIDNSVQPWRIHLPNEPRALVVVLRSNHEPMQKSSWSVLPPTWVNTAMRNRVALIEIYPAGDLLWEGIALQRTVTVMEHAIALHPNLASIPHIIFGVDNGARGAVAIVEQQPQRFAAIALHNPELKAPLSSSLSPSDKWLSLHRAGMKPAHVAGTTIIVSGIPNDGAQAWLARMRLTDTSIRDDLGTPAADAFWTAVTNVPAAAAPSEWIITEPGRYGAVVVEEMSEWGISGTLHWQSPTALQTTGIARLRLPDGNNILVNGAPYQYQARATDGAAHKWWNAACGPARHYAQRPFTVVIGTGESVAARNENHALATAFVNAWVAHAQGRPRIIEDIHFKAEQQRDRHLILIGNTRSNSVIQALIEVSPTFPLHWDTRMVTLAPQKSWLRADHRPLCVTWPHPAGDGRLLIILDGSARWLQPGLPLASVPDLAIGGITEQDPPAVWRYFDNNWR